jgi:hypothetical protein
MANWLEGADGLTSARLTVLAQAQPVGDTANILLHEAFFPYSAEPSVEVRTITEVDHRPASGFREWNTRGRYIPTKAPKQDMIKMIPIEGWDAIEEQEMQKIVEYANGPVPQQQMLAIVGRQAPDIVRKLVGANNRAMERYAMEAWTKGTITYVLAESDKSYTFTFGFDAGRLQTANTAWDDGGTNAYDDFVAWYSDGQDNVGPGIGAAMRRATYNAIRTDAPNPLSTSVKPLKSELEKRLQDEFGSDFKFYLIEHQFDENDDAGTAVTRTKYWPAQYVAYVPDGGVIGKSADAPVVRASQLAASFPDAQINVRGHAVYYQSENGGRGARIECQRNSMPFPYEQRVWTIDARV